MNLPLTLRPLVRGLLLCLLPVSLLAQGGGGGKGGGGGRGKMSANLRDATELIRAGKDAEALALVRAELKSEALSLGAANLLDTLGRTDEARKIHEERVARAADPAAKAAAQRALAMSHAFAGNAAETVRLEKEVIAYWVTQEKADPQNAFYQQGEMANEAARVCIDLGDLAAAETWYRKGTELGLKEPEPKTHPASLWNYRLAHALGRLAARRGDAAEAQRQVAAARRILDGDPKMAEAQERYFPYLVGYVALYTGDLKKADAELAKAVAAQGNQSDPFMTCLQAMTAEKQGDQARAQSLYRKAYQQATAHNPPAAFARPFARKKLGL